MLPPFLHRFYKLLHAHRILFSDVLCLFAVRCLQMGLGLVNVYLLARALTVQDFGHYQFVINVAGFVAISALPGLGDAVMQAVARGQQAVYHQAQVLSFLGCILGSAALLCAGVYFASRSESVFSNGFFLAALLFPFSIGLTFWKNELVGRRNFMGLALREASNAILVAGMLGLFLLHGEGRVDVALVIVFLVPALQNIMQTILAWRRVNYGDGGYEKSHLSYGLKLSLYTVVTTAARYLDKILIFVFLSPVLLAFYVIADKIADFGQMLVKDIAAAMGPRLIDFTHYTQSLQKAAFIFSLLFGLFLLIVAVFAVPVLLPVLFGEAYAEAVLYTQILLCSTIIGNGAVFKMRFLQSRLDDKALRLIMLGSNGLKIASGLIFIPLWGVWGAIFSVYIFRITGVILTGSAIRRYQDN